MLRNLITGAICCALPFAVAFAADKAPAPAPAVKFDAATVSGLGARNIGSATMSGRIAAIAARHEDDGRTTLFVGAASGGVWKSLDGGTTFKPVFDKQSVQSIGAIALDPNNPKTVWVGSGESWTRNSTSVGDGIFKSLDGGDTWTNMGICRPAARRCRWIRRIHKCCLPHCGTSAARAGRSVPVARMPASPAAAVCSAAAMAARAGLKSRRRRTRVSR
jgi:hypothetical protein